MKTVAILALAGSAAAFTSQNNAVRQSTQISETKVRLFLCFSLFLQKCLHRYSGVLCSANLWYLASIVKTTSDFILTLFLFFKTSSNGSHRPI